jgi:hypothetical protein
VGILRTFFLIKFKKKQQNTPEVYYAGLPETHFLKYPLLSQKQVDFFLFKAVVELVNANEHLTLLGLQKIVNIKASLNKGLPESLKEAFPN